MKFLIKAESEPVVKGARSLPLSNHSSQGKMIFGGSDDDVDVCLTCDLPASKCYGNNGCYLRRKKKKDRSGSNERQ